MAANGTRRWGFASQPAGPAEGADPAGADRRRGPADRRGPWRACEHQEITEAADVGFGSFYNHFPGKEQLFQDASEEVMERWGR